MEVEKKRKKGKWNLAKVKNMKTESWEIKSGMTKKRKESYGLLDMSAG